MCTTYYKKTVARTRKKKREILTESLVWASAICSSQSVSVSSADAVIRLSLVWLTPPDAKIAKSDCRTHETWNTHTQWQQQMDIWSNEKQKYNRNEIRYFKQNLSINLENKEKKNAKLNVAERKARFQKCGRKRISDERQCGCLLCLINTSFSFFFPRSFSRGISVDGKEKSEKLGKNPSFRNDMLLMMKAYPTTIISIKRGFGLTEEEASVLVVRPPILPTTPSQSLFISFHGTRLCSYSFGPICI